MVHADLVALETGYNRFPLKGEVEGAFTDVFRAIGRAIGLAARCHVPLGFLALSPSIVNLLHPRMRFAADADVFDELLTEMNLSHANLSNAINTIHYVSVGVADALGPGGFERYSPAGWAALFVA